MELGALTVHPKGKYSTCFNPVPWKGRRKTLAAKPLPLVLVSGRCALLISGSWIIIKEEDVVLKKAPNGITWGRLSLFIPLNRRKTSSGSHCLDQLWQVQRWMKTNSQGFLWASWESHKMTVHGRLVLILGSTTVYMLCQPVDCIFVQITASAKSQPPSQ